MPTFEKRMTTISWTPPAQAPRPTQATTSLEFFREMMRGERPPAPYAEAFGGELLQCEQGAVTWRTTPAEWMDNGVGVMQGGALVSCLDAAMGLAAMTCYPFGVPVPTLELSTRFIRAASLQMGALLIRGRTVHTGSRTATAEGEVVAEDGEDLIATATATFLVAS